ncbi:hypothetical protein [Streptomyces boncukensis]|uniref:Transcriptional regulator n=1 Tax=Streptomyces boncukensis TaxID=2711219 RepID=A0A6G4X2P6_9ACTN|nr:hypothetical protein [Streptomyces boncukensis]NGO71014.1 hypothetical protein [Streptomyces boncukensis]
MPRERNVKLKRLLLTYGYTHQDLADEVNRVAEVLYGKPASCTDRHVRRWISGEVRWPWARYLLPLQEIFGCAPEAMGFVPRGKWSRPVQPPAKPRVDRKGTVQRREFVAVGLTAALGIEAIPTVGRLGTSDAERIRNLVPALYVHDHALGGGALHIVAVEALARVHEALNLCSYGPRVERLLYSAAGDLAASAGWFAYDAGDQAGATDLYREALQSAMLAGDGALQARVWSNLAMQARLMHRDQEALRIGRAAVETRQAKDDPWLMALLHCRQAVGHARLGERGRSERSLSRAETAYEKTSGAPSPWLSFLTSAEITGLAGAAHQALGQHRRAEELTASALDQLEPRFERNRVYYTLQRAQVLLGCGEVEAAVAQARHAMGITGNVQSVRVRDKLASLRDSIGRYQTRVAREFCEQTREAE